MSLKDVIEKLTGPTRPKLAEAQRGAPRVEVPRLQVHTAENSLIITICPQTVEVVREIASGKQAATLTDGSVDVHLSPVNRETLPVKDPKKGWVVPLTPDDRQAILNTLQPAENGYEVTPSLSFIVENIEC